MVRGVFSNSVEVVFVVFREFNSGVLGVVDGDRFNFGVVRRGSEDDSMSDVV